MWMRSAISFTLKRFPPRRGIILSTIVTFAPSSINLADRLDPIKPKPPVTNTFFPKKAFLKGIILILLFLFLTPSWSPLNNENYQISFSPLMGISTDFALFLFQGTSFLTPPPSRGTFLTPPPSRGRLGAAVQSRHNDAGVSTGTMAPD